MRIEHLEYLICLAKEGSIQKAAPLLHTSHQNVSKILRQMEDELGVELFERSAKGLTLTASGQILLQSAQKIVVEFDGARQKLQHLQDKENLTGELHIYATPITSILALRTLIAAFQKQYPQTSLLCHEYETRYSLKQLVLHPHSVALVPLFNCADFRFVYEPYINDVMDYPLLKDRYIGIVRMDSTIGRQKSISLKKFIQNPLVMLPAQAMDQENALLRLFDSLGKYSICLCTGNHFLYVDAIVNGQGVGVSTQKVHSANITALAHSEVTTVEFREDVSFTVCLATARRPNLTPVGEAFVDFVKGYYALN